MNNNDINEVHEGQLEKDLTSLLNRYSAESVSGTPDFVLAYFVLESLKVFNETIGRRAEWRGESIDFSPKAFADAAPVAVAPGLIKQDHAYLYTTDNGHHLLLDSIVETTDERTVRLLFTFMDAEFQVAYTHLGFWVSESLYPSSQQRFETADDLVEHIIRRFTPSKALPPVAPGLTQTGRLTYQTESGYFLGLDEIDESGSRFTFEFNETDVFHITHLASGKWTRDIVHPATIQFFNTADEAIANCIRTAKIEEEVKSTFPQNGVLAVTGVVTREGRNLKTLPGTPDVLRFSFDDVELHFDVKNDRWHAPAISSVTNVSADGLLDDILSRCDVCFRPEFNHRNKATYPGYHHEFVK